MRSRTIPQPIGLYPPAYEHDACGTGFVASIDGVATHDIVRASLQCVCNVTHRGALSADAKTGDGAGVLTQIPQKLFVKVLAQLKAAPVAPGDLAVGVLFFSQDARVQAKAHALAEEAIRAHKLTLI